MSAANWPAAIALVLKDEGGYAERPTEGGGAVNRGITFTVFSAWEKAHGRAPPTFADLHAMSSDEAQAIYRAQFATPIHFDELPAGVGYVLLDSSVNNGVGGMFRMLAATLGTSSRRMDGITLAAIAQRGPESVINGFCDEREREQKSFKNYAQHITKTVLGRVIQLPRTWGQVWDGRVETVRKRALAMVDGAQA